MAIARVVLTFPNSLLGLPGPLASNTLHFESLGEEIDEAFGDGILDVVVPPFQSMATLMCGGASHIANAKVYDLSDAEPREPVALREFGIDPDETSLPGECSINVHFRGARVTGVPAQRARATIQLGPLGLDALNSATGHVATAAHELVAEQFGVIATGAAGADFPWVVGSLAHGYVQIVAAYVDNEFGTVGSRQRAVSASTAIDLA